MTLEAWQTEYYRSIGISEQEIAAINEIPDAADRVVIVSSDDVESQYGGHVSSEDCWCQPECVPVQADDGSITYLYNHRESP